jgi:hypothetical protein
MPVSPAEGGRPWVRVESEHFAIVTDFDRDDAESTARLLEEGFDAIAHIAFVHPRTKMIPSATNLMRMDAETFYSQTLARQPTTEGALRRAPRALRSGAARQALNREAHRRAIRGPTSPRWVGQCGDKCEVHDRYSEAFVWSRCVRMNLAIPAQCESPRRSHIPSRYLGS